MNLRKKIFAPLLIVGCTLAAYIAGVWSPRMIADAAAQHRAQYREHLVTVAHVLTGALLANDLAAIYQVLDTLRANNPHWRQLRVENAQGILLYPLAESPRDAADADLIHLTQELRYQEQPLGTLAATLDIRDLIELATAHTRELTWWLLAGLTAILLALGAILELTLRRPLVRLIDAAQAIADGNYDSALPRPTRDEIGALVTRFATMRSALQERDNTLLKTTNELRAQKQALDEHAIVGVSDADGRFVYVNDRFCARSGYARDALLGMNHLYLCAKLLDEDALRRVQDTIGCGEIWRGELVQTRADGGTYITDTTLVPFRDGANRPWQYVQIHTDVTARHDAEQHAVRISTRMKHLLDSSPTAIYASVPSGDFRITYVSDNVRAILGHSPDDMCAHPDFWHDHIHPQDRARVFSALPQLFVHNRHEHEYRFMHQDGMYHWIHDQLRLVRGANGDPLEIVGSLTDISQRKKMEEVLLEYRDHLQEMVEGRTHELVAARDDALGAERAMSAFLANMSHELRTPLHGILSYANFGLKKIDRADRDKLLQYFGEIRDSGQHLLGLVNNLLDLSKLRAGKMSYDYGNVDLCELIGAVKDELLPILQDKQLTINVACPAAGLEVLADRDRIGQVVRNLLSNAVKFSPAGGSIAITVDACDGGATLCVADQGVGVPDNELTLIFDAFTQSSKTRTGAGGTGLGLAICKEIVETGHGGSIAAANNPQGGACFTVTLPVRAAPALERAS